MNEAKAKALEAAKDKWSGPHKDGYGAARAAVAHGWAAAEKFFDEAIENSRTEKARAALGDWERKGLRNFHISHPGDGVVATATEKGQPVAVGFGRDLDRAQQRLAYFIGLRDKSKVKK